MVHLVRTERETDDENTGTKENREERAKSDRKSGKRHQNYEDTEKDEGAGARHRRSISGLHNDDKLPSHRIRMCDEMRLHLCDASRNDFLMDLGKFASDDDSRNFECA